METPTRPNIVLVEDDSNVARLISSHLTRNGFEVSTAATLAAARVRLASDWDVLILDRRLPDGDGVELCAEIRTTAPYAFIIMLTGDAARESKIASFAHGADDYVTKPCELDELTARVRSGARIVALQKALLQTNRRLEKLSLEDSLTSLRNRRGYDQGVEPVFELALRHSRPLTLLMVDIDRFKSINDLHGHAEGDAVLRGMGRLLASLTRKSDIVARLGGEEFAVVLPETTIFEGIQTAEKIRASVAATSLGSQPAGEVTVSVGLANMPHTEATGPGSLLRAADEALYRAKQNGRNRVEVERRRRPSLRETAAVPERRKLR